MPGPPHEVPQHTRAALGLDQLPWGVCISSTLGGLPRASMTACVCLCVCVCLNQLLSISGHVVYCWDALLWLWHVHVLSLAACGRLSLTVDTSFCPGQVVVWGCCAHESLNKAGYGHNQRKGEDETHLAVRGHDAPTLTSIPAVCWDGKESGWHGRHMSRGACPCEGCAMLQERAMGAVHVLVATPPDVLGARAHFARTDNLPVW